MACHVRHLAWPQPLFLHIRATRGKSEVTESTVLCCHQLFLNPIRTHRVTSLFAKLMPSCLRAWILSSAQTFQNVVWGRTCLTKTSVAIWLHSPSSESTWFSILVWLDGAGIIGRVGLGMNEVSHRREVVQKPINIWEDHHEFPRQRGTWMSITYSKKTRPA